MNKPKYVDVETPYRANTEDATKKNILYARACVRDCIMKGEVPFASHLFFTQPGILDDTIQAERDRGIRAGKLLIEGLPDIVTVVYTNLGISEGMQIGINRAKTNGRSIDWRTLPNDWERKELEIARRHSHAKIWGVK